MISEDHITRLIIRAVPPLTSPPDRIQAIQRRVRRQRLRRFGVSTATVVTLVAMTTGIFAVLNPGLAQCGDSSRSNGQPSRVAQYAPVNAPPQEQDLRKANAALPMLAAILALGGCSSHESPQVATAPRPSSIPSGSTPVTANPTTTKGPYDELYEQGLRFTRCMTDHGITIADPRIGDPLEYGINQRQTKQETYDAAIQACKQFAPSTWPYKEDATTVVKEAPFRKCVREHGGYAPEPDSNGMMLYLSLVYPPGVESPAQNQAEKACYGLLDDPALKQGN